MYCPHHRLGFLSTGDVEIKGGMKVIHKKVSALCLNYKNPADLYETLFQALFASNTMEFVQKESIRIIDINQVPTMTTAVIINVFSIL